jgi:DNA repair protein RadC
VPAASTPRKALRFPLVADKSAASALRQRFDFRPCGAGAQTGSTRDHPTRCWEWETPLARALTMRVYECKLTYALVSLGEEVQLNRPEKVAEYLRSAFDEHPMQEAFYCVYLDRKNHPIGRHLITLGTVDSTLVSAREVFRGAILASASAMVVAHNHPSGDPSPSAPDVNVTRKLRESAKVLDIELLDHVIVGNPESDPQHRGMFSFREAGLL